MGSVILQSDEKDMAQVSDDKSSAVPAFEVIEGEGNVQCRPFGQTAYLRKYIHPRTGYITHEADSQFSEPLEACLGFLSYDPFFGVNRVARKVCAGPFFLVPG